MLTIIHKDKTSTSWTLPMPAVNMQEVLSCEVLSVDGKEEDYLFHLFGGNSSFNIPPSIPWCYNRDKGQTWYGDIARTIMANL